MIFLGVLYRIHSRMKSSQRRKPHFAIDHIYPGIPITQVVNELHHSGYGISEHSLRIYERRGLLQNVPRQGNFRRYSKNNIEQIKFIQDLLVIGLKMAQIAWLYRGRNYLESMKSQRKGKKSPNLPSKNLLKQTLKEWKSMIRKYRKTVRAVNNQKEFFTKLNNEKNMLEKMMVG